MRNAIRSKLVTEVTALDEVYQPTMPDKDSKKPYAVVKFTEDIRTDLTHSFNKDIEVWVYTERTNFNTLDTLVEACIKALTEAELITTGDKRFGLECVSVSADGYTDPTLEALTKTITFRNSFIRRY